MEWYTECLRLLHEFQTKENSGPFLTPVKWKDWNLPDYPHLIKQPMDMSTIESKFNNKEYKYPFEFAYDMRLIFRNCMTFNMENSELYKEAQVLLEEFDRKFNSLYEYNLTGKGFVSASDKDMLVYNINQLNSNDLGKLIQLLEYRCPSSIIMDGESSLSINIDAIDVNTFFICTSFVEELIEHARILNSRGIPEESIQSGGLSQSQNTMDGSRIMSIQSMDINTPNLSLQADEISPFSYGIP